MLQIWQNLPEYFGTFLQILGGLVLFASAIARLTPTPKDDELVMKAEGWFYKVISWMPTIGVNPNTAKMKELLARLTQGK